MGAGVQRTALLFAITVVVITCPTRSGWPTRRRSWSAPDWGQTRVLFKTRPPWRPRRIDTVVMDKTGTLTKG